MGRSPDQNREIKRHRREQILSVSLALFSSKGLSATKISDISRATGMSQGLLYHYFPSKDAIFVEIIRTAFSLLNAACLGLEAAPEPPGEKIRMALDALVRNLENDPDAARYHVLIAEANLSDAIPEEARQIIESESNLPYQVFEHILTAGQRDGTVRSGNPAQMAVAFWTTIKGLALHRAVHGERARLPEPSLFLPVFLKEF